jgi:uncharacterized protein (TIGR02594 family)
MKKYIVTASSLNLREAGSPTASIIGTLKKGEEVQSEKTSADNYWHYVTCNDGQKGWVSGKYLAPASDDNALLHVAEEFLWMAIAVQEIGTKETAGAGDSPRVVEYLRSTTLPKADASNDETPWCSAFVNWCVERSGVAGTDSAWARGWLHWGKAAAQPRRGCIVVFERGESSGHVAFFIAEEGDYYKVLGGNQHNEVCISKYLKSRLLGFRVMS